MGRMQSELYQINSEENSTVDNTPIQDFILKIV